MSITVNIIKKEIDRCKRIVDDRKAGMEALKKNTTLNKQMKEGLAKTWQSEISTAEKDRKDLESSLAKL